MLKDLVGSIGLAFFPIASLLIFFVVFLAVLVRSMRTAGPTHREQALGAILDDRVAPTAHAGGRHAR